MAKLAKLSSKNQLTLPKEIVDHFPGVSYFEVRDAGAEIVLAPVKTVPAANYEKTQQALEMLRKHFDGMGITENDVEDAVAWARARRRARAK